MRSDLDGRKKGIGFSFAWNGLIQIIKLEKNIKIHFFITVLVLCAGVFFHVSLMEWTILVLVVGFVLVTEIINSVIERVMDYLNPEIHPSAKLIKDISAGAVLLSAIISIVIGLIIFLPKCIELFF